MQNRRSRAAPTNGSAATDTSIQSELSIGDAAEATGISSETLRIWERRYGRPVPIRRPSGHRRYTADQVRWLRRVAEAVARGHRPGIVVPMTDAELDELLEEGMGIPEPVRPEIARLMEHVLKFNGQRFVDALEEAWRGRGPVAFLNEVVAPLSEEVGRRWADGNLEIRHEHYVTGILDDFLRARYTQFVPPMSGPVVLLATLSGEHHSLGIRMAALVCASEGVIHRVLGPDTPNPDIVACAEEAGVNAVAISVSLATGGVETDRVLADLRFDLPDHIRLVVGGKGARGIRQGPRGIEYCTSLDDWARWLRSFRTTGA